MRNWVYLIDRTKDSLENMIVPKMEHPPKPDWTWLFYVGYCVFQIWSKGIN